MAWTLIGKPTYATAVDGVYTDGSTDGAITEPPTDGAYADTGDGWTPVYVLYAYPVWTLVDKSTDVTTSGVPVEAGAYGVLISEGEVGILSATSVWTRIEVPS